MATQYRRFAVTIPAGTPKATPVVINTRFEPFTVTQINIRIPPGPLGQMGFQIASSRVQVIPWATGQFIVANDEPLSYPVTDAPNSGDWQVIGYNTGVFDHTIQVEFAMDPNSIAIAAATTQPLSAAELSQGTVTDIPPVLSPDTVTA